MNNINSKVYYYEALVVLIIKWMARLSKTRPQSVFDMLRLFDTKILKSDKLKKIFSLYLPPTKNYLQIKKYRFN